jgi:hypothetical protein
LPLQAYQELFFQLPGFTTSFHSRTPKLKKKISLGLKKQKKKRANAPEAMGALA